MFINFTIIVVKEFTYVCETCPDASQICIYVCSHVVRWSNMESLYWTIYICSSIPQAEALVQHKKIASLTVCSLYLLL